MCGLCAVLNAKNSWSDLAGKSEFSKDGQKIHANDERDVLLGMINRIFKYHQLTLSDWGGSSYILTNRQQQNRNVYDVTGVLGAADELLKDKVFDPLDHDLLNYLSLMLGENHEQS